MSARWPLAGRDRRVELRGGMVGEARQADIAHRALGEVLDLHLGRDDAATISTSNGTAFAHDRQRHRGVLRAAHAVAGHRR